MYLQKRSNNKHLYRGSIRAEQSVVVTVEILEVAPVKLWASEKVHPAGAGRLKISQKFTSDGGAMRLPLLVTGIQEAVVMIF